MRAYLLCSYNHGTQFKHCNDTRLCLRDQLSLTHAHILDVCFLIALAVDLLQQSNQV